MTSFRKINRVLLTEKMRLVGWIVVLYVAAVFLSLLPVPFKGDVFNRGWSNLLLKYSIGWGSLVMLLAGVVLAWSNERIYTVNRYRLLPISDLKIYGANLFSSLIAYVLVFLVELIFVLIYYLFNIKTVRGLINHSFGGFELQLWTLVLLSFLVSLLTVLFWWSLTSLVHLLTAALSRILPSKHQLGARIILYAILTIIVVFSYFKIRSWLLIIGRLPFIVTSGNYYMKPLWTAIVLLIFIVLLAVDNVWLLKNQVETKQ